MSAPRLAGLLERLAHLGSRCGVDIESQLEGGAAIEAAIVGLERIEAHFLTLLPKDFTNNERLQAIEAALFGLVQLDFSQRAPVSPVDDQINAIAIGINCLAEELSMRAVSKSFVDQVIESMQDGLVVTDTQGQITLANQAAHRLLGRVNESLSGERLTTFFSQLSIEDVSKSGGVIELSANSPSDSGQRLPLSMTLSLLRDADSKMQGMVCVLRDLSEHIRQEEERWRLREEVQRQAFYVDELSCPLIPLSDHVLVMPIIGSVDARRSDRIVEVLLQGIVERRARMAILDITGVRIMNNTAIDSLLRAVTGARLLGAQVAITGIRPDVARSLVNNNINLCDVLTFRSLQDGITHAISTWGR